VPRAQKISGYVDVPGCDNMLNALAGRPIATAADASTWFDYESGILTNCKNNPNHGIFLVGATNDYWKLKNSWGGDWGEKGYIRIERGNSCGICNQGSYPIL
jgi:C1A family cysteine protease